MSTRVKPVGQGAIGKLGHSFNQMVGNLQELHRSRNLLSCTMSPKVRQSLIENGLDFRGLIKTVGILFIDIRDFTRITEKHNTEQLVIFLNDYYTTIANQVHIEGGIIGKYGGDSILAYFGAPDSHPPHEIASAALLTALALHEAMDKLSERWTFLGMPPIKVGMCSRSDLVESAGQEIDIDPVVAGPIGSADQFEYTVIGDAVNLASRLQDLTRNVPGINIIFSVEVYEALDERIKEQVKIIDFDAYTRQLGHNGSQHPIRCVDLGEVLVKGKQGPVHVFGVPDL